MSEHEVSTLSVVGRGTEFACLVAGDPEGPLALCLHGFPDSAATWQALLAALAGAGFRAAAPYLRGYAPSSVPADGGYQAGAYAADAVAIHAALGGDERSVLIGHDIGAVAAYGAAGAEPNRWQAVVTLSVPPLPVLAAGMASYEQLRRSWYTFLFQHPAAESILTAPGFLEGLVAEWSPDWDATNLVADARAAFASPENVTAAIGYYRAGFRPESWDPDLQEYELALYQPVSQPWLYLHGDRDGCIGADVARAVPGARIIDGAGHFLPRERPDEVAAAILDFLPTPA